LTRRHITHVDFGGGPIEINVTLHIEENPQLGKLHELLIKDYERKGHHDPELASLEEIGGLIRDAHTIAGNHFQGVKGRALDQLVAVQRESLAFYEDVFQRKGPDVERLRGLVERSRSLFDELHKPPEETIRQAPKPDPKAVVPIERAEAVKPTPPSAGKRASDLFAKLRAKYESVLKESSDFREALARIERDAASVDPQIQRRAARERAELEKLMQQYSKASQLKKESAKVERRGRAENRAHWLGRETDTEFARHEQDLNSIARTLANKRDALRAAGRTDLLPEGDATVLNMPIDRFIEGRGSADLNAEWTRLNADPSLRKQLNTTFDLAKDPRVGARRPDIVEFFLAEKEIVITDITLDVESSIHQFKTRFYREVLHILVGGEGPEIYGHDIDPRIRPSAPRGVIHDEPLPL
jgi:hypothetical protein